MKIRNLSSSVTIAFACCALTACSVPATDDASVQANTGADASDTSAAPAGSATPATPEYTFELFTRQGAPVSDPRIVYTQQEHPCGPLNSVRVPAIPMDDPVFVPAYVVEFDAQGKEIAKWGIPVEADVVGLDAQRLEFQTSEGRFWVTTQGALEPVDGAAAANNLPTTEGMFDCPKLPTFGESGAEQCFKVKDAAGTERRIALEGTCS